MVCVRVSGRGNDQAKGGDNERQSHARAVREEQLMAPATTAAHDGTPIDGTDWHATV